MFRSRIETCLASTPHSDVLAMYVVVILRLLAISLHVLHLTKGAEGTIPLHLWCAEQLVVAMNVSELRICALRVLTAWCHVQIFVNVALR